MIGKNPTDMKEAREDYIRRMEKNGFTILYPNDDELFIDIDNPQQMGMFTDQLNRANSNLVKLGLSLSIDRDDISPSGNPHRRHIVVKTVGFTVSSEERIAWQACLGSDPVREILSLVRTLWGDDNPTLFAEKP